MDQVEPEKLEWMKKSPSVKTSGVGLKFVILTKSYRIGQFRSAAQICFFIFRAQNNGRLQDNDAAKTASWSVAFLGVKNKILTKPSSSWVVILTRDLPAVTLSPYFWLCSIWNNKARKERYNFFLFFQRLTSKQDSTSTATFWLVTRSFQNTLAYITMVKSQTGQGIP